MSAIKNYVYVGVGIVLLMLLGYLYYLNDRLESTKSKLELANQNISSLNHYINKTNQQLKAIQQLDKDYQEKLTHAQIENDKLRDSIANGTKRLYVKTNCPMPTNTATTGKPDATNRTELDRETGQRIIRIVQDGDHAIMQLSALQKYVNEVCLKR